MLKYKIIFLLCLSAFLLLKDRPCAAEQLPSFQTRTNINLYETFRIENKTYPLFDNKLAGKRNFSFNMIKLQLEEKIAPDFSFNLSLLDYRYFYRAPSDNAGISATNSEISVLNMRFEEFLGNKKLKAVIGRQESVCKECRVMGLGNWIIGRIWDGVRLTYYDTPSETLDFYSFEVKRTPVDPPCQSRGIYYYNETRGVELYVMNKVDRNKISGEMPNGNPGNVDVKTFGYKQAKKIGKKIVAKSEIAYQKGMYGPDEHRAHASHFEVKYDAPVSLIFEYNEASGDNDPKDGRHETFDNLFPANYGKYGYMNYMSWQNMKEYCITGTKTFKNDLNVKAGFHKFMLNSPYDAWYNSFLSKQRSDPSGKSGTDIGREVDIIFTKKLNKNTDMEFGTAKFFAGDFVKNTASSGDSTVNSVWTYFQLSKKCSF